MAGTVPLAVVARAAERARVRRSGTARPWLRPAALVCGLLALAACGRAEPEAEPDRAERRAGAAAPAATPAARGFHPIVDAGEAQLFGAAADGRWLPADSAAPLMAEGITYRLYTLTGRVGERQGGGVQPPLETCSNPTLAIAGAPQLEDDLIAIGGAWDALPREPSLQSPEQPAYREALAEWLHARDIADPVVSITQLLRVDLDGNGADEVLLAANLLRGRGTSAQPGDYSVVLLRRVEEGEVRTVPLAEEYYPQGCIADCAPAAHRVAAVLDLNGDGLLEIVLAWRDYEGRGKTIYRLSATELEEVLSWVCAP